ncbi:MAG: hypothetical protein N2544_17270 [Burkholderiales bacterium]|nr:hypothetical protein [Burkholderiales bacterium]
MQTALALRTAALAALLAGVVVLAACAREDDAAGARTEACATCHAGVTGLDAAHARIGCAACHGGDRKATEATPAHRGLVPIPGNLADAPRTCGQAGCHEAIVPRVERSIMATMAGVIAVNRKVLGEPDDPSAPPPHASRLGHGVADSHLRELCVGCHLGQARTETGPIGEDSLGGGCNACHLVYGDTAKAAHEAYAAAPRGKPRNPPAAHPSFTVNPTNGHCFGCHSRSGRVALSYEGWHELRGEPSRRDARVRTLADERRVEHVVADVHHERGLACIDCHTAWEVMGSGAVVARKSEQLRIVCADCHAARLASVAPEEADPESRALLALRKWTFAPGERLGAGRNGDVLVNVTVDRDGRGTLRGKLSGATHPLEPPAAACTQGAGHARLACGSCHSAWAPRCTTCHTEFDAKGEGFDWAAQKWVKGTWNESSGPFEAALPTLGVRTDHGAPGGPRELVDTFVPGMILTFDRNRDPDKPPDVIFRRLYAHVAPHTVRREVRSCESCHADPVALGYGRGRLAFDKAAGRWRFTPKESASPHDGLPADAWTGFLAERTGMVSTREDARPFTVAEQRRILTAGACLACHAGSSAVMQQAIADFDGVLARRSRRCVVPTWR